MTSLMDSVKEMMTDAIIDQAAGLIGIEPSTTQASIGKFLPAIIGGLISKGSNESGAAKLLDLFRDKGFGDDNIRDLGSILSDTDKSNSMLETGSDLLGTLFGNNQTSILDKLVSMTGIKKAGGSILMKMLAPIVVNKLAGMALGNNWGAQKLSSYLNGQKSSILGMLPGMGSLLGFADQKAAAASTITNTTTETKNSGGGGGWLKWLLLPLLALAALWFLTKDGCNNKTTMDSNMDTEISHDGHDHSSHDGHDHAAHDGHDHAAHGGQNEGTMTTTEEETNIKGSSMDYALYTVSDNGDILDGTGKIMYANGSYNLDAKGNVVDNNGNMLIDYTMLPTTFAAKLKAFMGKYSGTKLTVDANGNLVDGNGKILFKKGEYSAKNGFYYDAQGNKLGRIWDKIVGAIKDGANAVGDAAEKSVDAMKMFFGDLVSKKAGVQTNYTLNNITFNSENHRISNFTKSEVEGLAAALKENENGKVEVQVYTNDGASSKENDKLSKARAQVVHDMLVTLGVNSKQISFKGMGDSDAAKATGDKVEIVAK